MSASTDGVIARILKAHEAELLDEWVREQSAGLRSGSKIKESDLRNQSSEFLNLLLQATQSGNLSDVYGPAFGRVRDMLGDLSRSRGHQGFSPSETAMFVFSLKRPLFSLLQRELS